MLFLGQKTKKCTSEQVLGQVMSVVAYCPREVDVSQGSKQREEISSSVIKKPYSSTSARTET